MRIKTIAVICILLTFTGSLILTGCGESYNAPAGIIGQWDCRDYASNEETETGFYALTVEEDGSFSLYDQVAGNPGISGKMYCDDTGNLGIINIECDEEDFDPPACWNISKEARLRYKVLDKDTIKLGYVGIWLIFDRAK
ncbi:MAG: hypothetical protein Q4A65_08690 [Bacillota bacterium]|nr:hypothetical protein [Bacillota bacterium]